MRKGIGVGAGLGLGAIVALPATAQADDFTVTNLNDSGAGSLREAIEDSNDNTGADRILFNSKLSGTITLEGPDPDIRDDVSILGPSARKLTVSGDEQRVFFIQGDIDVDISGLTLTGGNPGPSFSGGAIVLVDSVDLTLSRSVISGNSSGLDGGAIGTYGAASELTVQDSTISGNYAFDDGGGIAIHMGGKLTIRNSTISGNTAGEDGGGLYLESSLNGTRVLSSTVTANSAGDQGGGIYEDGAGGTLRGAIVAGNTDDTGFYRDLYQGQWPTSFSIIGDSDDATFVDGGGNLLDVDPLLKPLANNGGPTDTHAFKKSPAKNAGPPDAPDKDQRGAPRKGQPDIGAYELTKCKGVIVNRVGTTGKDKLKGTKKKDGMLGLGGNDKLKGKKGKDGLCGGRGKDKLKGGPGKDKFNGGPGRDKEIQ